MKFEYRVRRVRGVEKLNRRDGYSVWVVVSVFGGDFWFRWSGYGYVCCVFVCI